jgi:redox-sensitive bicupin YhaK (pirin superfamily)
MAENSRVAAEQCIGLGALGETMQSFPTKEVKLGALPVAQALPVRNRRLVGPWCFLDRFGPLTFADGKPMDVATHPHIGLQTVTWLLDGEIVHNDSLNLEALVRPGA